uniref:Lipoyl synthase N-terminal domain-containing protein n=1 Tax=Aegilops tauschii subsp. strangulata TaxID=200361 RepID=A0A453FLG3_AEGTS
MHSSLARQVGPPIRPGCADQARRDRSGSVRCHAEAAPPVSVARTGPYTGRDPEVKKPAWLRQRAAQGEKYARMRESLGELKLNTVCVEAQCPNIGEVFYTHRCTPPAAAVLRSCDSILRA